MGDERNGPPCKAPRRAPTREGPMSALSSSTSALSSNATTSVPYWTHGPLFDVYERRGFSRSGVADGRIRPLSTVAVFSADSPMPAQRELVDLAQRFSRQRVPCPLHCAAVSRSDVLFFEVEASASARPSAHAVSAAEEVRGVGTH